MRKDLVVALKGTSQSEARLNSQTAIRGEITIKRRTRLVVRGDLQVVSGGK